MNKKGKNDSGDIQALALENLELQVLPALNDEPDGPHLDRIAKVIAWLARLNEDVPERAKADALGELRKLLSRYRWVNRIALTASGFTVSSTIADRGRISDAERWEQDVIKDLLTALPRLGLGKDFQIRRCKRCERWFLAPRRDKRTCSRACYQWLVDNRPGQKEAKALYMRQLRTDVKERERRQNRLAGIMPKKRKGTQ